MERKGSARSWEAMCRYAADVRQGLWPDRVPTERALQAIYLTLAQEMLLGARPDRDRFLEEALLLCEHVGKQLAEGARLLDDDLFAKSPAFERYSSLLSADRDLYREDLGRGKRFFAEIPASHSPTRTARRLPLAFPAWIARMGTPDADAAAIRRMQASAPEPVRRHFAVEPDGSFLVDTAMIEADLA